jgi:hypothetical protein
MRYIGQFGRHLRSVEIRPQGYVIHTDPLDDIVDVTDYPLDRYIPVALPVRSRHAGREEDAHHPLGLSHGIDLLAREISR